MATGRVNVGDGGGGGMNVYAQQSEPTKKEGIWIQTNTAKKNIINDLELWFKDKWNDPALKAYADVPFTNNNYPLESTTIGTDVYVAGTGSVNFYKYNSVTNTWTQLPNLPANDYYMALISVGTNIYFISPYTIKTYKYDTLTNIWTEVAKPINISSGFTVRCAVVATDIWCFFTSSVNYTPLILKYDTVNNTWVSKPSVGYQYQCKPVAVGSDIYLIGFNASSTAQKTLGVYSTLDNSLKYLLDAPFTGGPPAVAIGKDIHCMSGSLQHYIYNTISNTWTLYPVATPIKVGNLEYVGNAIVAFEFGAGASVKPKNYRFNFISKVYEDGTVIIYRLKSYPGTYQTELISLPSGLFTGVNNRILSVFDNVYMYANGTLNEFLPTYYGDGTKWVKFK